MSRLRALPDTEVLGTSRCLTVSGNTFVARQVLGPGRSARYRMARSGDDDAPEYGLTLMATPTVGRAGHYIDLELEPELTRRDNRGYGPASEAGGRHVVSAIECQTKILLGNGYTAVLCGGVPPPVALPSPQEYDPRPVLMLVRARTVPVGDSSYHVVLEE